MFDAVQNCHRTYQCGLPSGSICSAHQSDLQTQGQEYNLH